MAANLEDKGAHKLTLNERERLTVTGVKQVVSFDENAVSLETCRGDLLIRGEGLKLKTLSQDGGQVAVEGQVDFMAYEEPRAAGGFFRRLFGT